MAGIETYLDLIKNAVYGREVRQAIHDGIHACYEDGKAGAVDLVAREQIAELVAPSGEAPSAAEVTDARIGADGKTYTSLGLANRTQFSNLIDDLLAMNAEVESVNWQTGYYTDTHAINPTATTWRCGELAVDDDYKYFFAGGNTSVNHPLIFMSNVGGTNIKSIAGGAVYEMQELILPANTTKLYISYEQTTPVTVIKVPKYISDDAINLYEQKNGVVGAFYERQYSYNAPNRTINTISHGFNENVTTIDKYGNAAVYSAYKTIFTYNFICNDDIVDNGLNVSFGLISNGYVNPQACNIRIYNATDSAWVYQSDKTHQIGASTDIKIEEYVPKKYFSGLSGKALILYFRSDANDANVTAGTLTINRFTIELYRGAVSYHNIEEYVSDVIQPDFIPPTASASAETQTTPDFTTLVGKTWNAVGDSVTARGTYITGVDARLGLNGVNLGVSACTMAINNTYLQNQSIVERVLGLNGNTSPADADIWTIMGGYNDQLYNTPMGDIESTDMSTYYGALKAVCEYIRKRPNNPKLIIMTPAQSYRDGEYMHDIVKACHDVGKLYAAPVIDIFNESGICPANLNDVTEDQLHPNVIGYQMLCSVISAGITRNC